LSATLLIGSLGSEWNHWRIILRYLLYFLSVLISITYVSCTPWYALHWYQTKPLSPQQSVSLTGKKILIDPGHGNNTSGSIGKFGTKEKDVNLAVARLLKKMLEKQGASVYLTREDDDSTLWFAKLNTREELSRRCLIRDSITPDLFVSLHHNGSEHGSRKVNNSKTFYAAGDAGASLDAAQFINKEFTELLGLGPSSLLCGNYFVLRNSKVPTLLGEPSYLSHPAMERLLHDSTALNLEASAYFRGIVNWIAPGVPKVTGFSIDSVDGSVTAIISSETPLDPLLTNLFCDGTRLNGMVCQNGYTAALQVPLSNGIHTFKCRAGNTNGNLSMIGSFSDTIDRPAWSLIATVEKQPVGALVRLRVSVLDCYGFPVLNGTKVLQKDQDTAYTADGVAYFYIPVSQTTKLIDITCGNVTTQITIPAGLDGLVPFQGFISSSDAKFKIPTSLMSISGTRYALDRCGFFSINPADTSSHITATFTAAGFLDTTESLSRGKVNLIKLTPCAQGVMIGKKIIIDPEFGGTESGGINRSGIRACDITRKCAYETVGLLQMYGGEVCLARQDDRTIHITERVFTAENHAAEMYIIIRSDSVKQSPYISYYYGSTLGKKIAEKMAIEWQKVSGDSATVLEEFSLVMQQTQCPAVTLSLCPLNVLDPLDHKNSQKIAQTVLNGLTDFYLEIEHSTGKNAGVAVKGN
jgi:N-acetylmuramoyl-L-alanine amidase